MIQCTETLLACLLCRLPDFNAQMLSNVIWACATMGFADDAAFIESAAQAAIQMGKHLREQVRAKTWTNAYFKCFAVMPECCLTVIDCLTPSLHQRVRAGSVTHAVFGMYGVHLSVPHTSNASGFL